MNSTDFFENAPILQVKLPDFDQALERAVNDETDTLAFSALTTHLTVARERGDLDQLYQMSMVLGATACMHDHMQEMASNSTADIFSKNIDHEKRDKSHEDHDHSDDDDEDEKGPFAWLRRHSHSH